MSLRERILFLGNFCCRFRETGAITPSSRALARTMVAGLGTASEPQRILEVGPGTGSFTLELIPLLGPDDELHLCEVNTSLLDFLKKRIERDGCFPHVGRNIVYHPCPVQELKTETSYHHIVSGLPFNNFPADLVQEILEDYRRRLLPGGTLRFFEYLGIRRIKAPFAKPAERRRLRDISAITGDLCRRYAVRRTVVWANLPPAVAWCLSFDAAES